MSRAFALGFQMLKEDPCWDGYEQVGMKNKGGRQVPNCVPASKKIPDSKPKKKKVSKAKAAPKKPTKKVKKAAEPEQVSNINIA